MTKRTYCYRNQKLGIFGFGFSPEEAIKQAKKEGFLRASEVKDGFITVLPEGVVSWGIGDFGSLFFNFPDGYQGQRSFSRSEMTVYVFDKKEKFWVIEGKNDSDLPMSFK